MIISGGTTLTPDGWLEADVTISHGLVESIDASGRATDAAFKTLDASGCLVGPGFVDIHTHLREPGQTWKEDISSGSRAAAVGGFTAIVAMPNTDPPIDSTKVVDLVAALGEAAGIVDVAPAAALTLGRGGTQPVDLMALYEAGVRIFTDDGDSVADPGVLRQVMEIVADLPGAVVAQHAEDAAMTAGGHMHEGEVSRRLGIGGLPASAEADVVRRDLQLVRETGAHYHCQHVSSKMTVDMIGEAKQQGLRVTAEVTPHHLTFHDAALSDLDTNFKMYPPLRTEEDRVALGVALADGTIDAVATDHAPHQDAEKAVSFDQAPRGVIGLETAASAVWEVFGDRDILFRALSTSPASIAGLKSHGRPLREGSEANLVIFDPNAGWKADEFASKSSNSPYLGREMRGRVKATLHRGVLTYEGRER